MAKNFQLIHRMEMVWHGFNHAWLDVRDWGDSKTAECQCGKRWSA